MTHQEVRSRHAPGAPEAADAPSPEAPTCPIPSYAGVKARVFLDVRAGEGVESSWGVRTDEARLFECPASGLRFRMPAPPEKIAAFYRSEYHERMSGGGEDTRRAAAYRRENRERIRALQRHCPSGKVLDVGCSTGLFASQLREAGYDVLGCDISADACRSAATLLGEDRVICAPVQDLVERRRGQLDAITLMDVIEHFDDVVPPLRAMRDLLRPGGVLFLRTPTLSSPFYKVADLSYRLSLGRYTDAVLKIYHAEHFYFFTEQAIRTLLEDTGFEVLSIEADPLLWENFRSAEMRQGPVVNTVLAAVYLAGRLAGRGHGMKVVARRPL